MAKLTEKARTEVQSWLEDLQKIDDALEHVSKAAWFTQVAVTHEDGTDDVFVNVDHKLAKDALLKQREVVAKALAKHGIEVS